MAPPSSFWVLPSIDQIFIASTPWVSGPC